MTRKLLALVLVLASVQALAAAPLPARTPDNVTLEQTRLPMDRIREEMLGVTSRAVRFDWRKSSVGVGLIGSQILELNSFASARVGALVRKPLGDFMVEFALTRVFTWGSDSTRKLALTPYRQLGRPSRFELDVNLGYPLAEGVVTPRLKFLSAAELVFSADVGFRYLFYPGALAGASAGDVVKSIFAPKLSEREVSNLESQRLPGMQVDSGRYDLLAGFSLDVYFHSGFFLSPRVMFALPVFGANDTRIGAWWELSFAAGWHF